MKKSIDAIKTIKEKVLISRESSLKLYLVTGDTADGTYARYGAHTYDSDRRQGRSVREYETKQEPKYIIKYLVCSKIINL